MERIAIRPRMVLEGALCNMWLAEKNFGDFMVYSLAYSCRGHMAFRELQGESIAGCIPNPKGSVVGAQVPQKKDWFHLPVECM